MKKYNKPSSEEEEIEPKSSVGHAHAQRNLEYTFDAIKRAALSEAIGVRYFKYDHWSDRIIEPIYVTFSWKQKGINFAYPISFHQDQSSFKQELDRFLSTCPKKKVETYTQPLWYQNE